MYVAEAGMGGTLRCAVIRGTVCVGRTGSVSRYWRGHQQRIVEVAAEGVGVMALGHLEIADRRGIIIERGAELPGAVER